MGDECCNAPSTCDSNSSTTVTKEEYVGKMEGKLAELGANIDDLLYRFAFRRIDRTKQRS